MIFMQAQSPGNYKFSFALDNVFLVEYQEQCRFWCIFSFCGYTGRGRTSISQEYNSLAEIRLERTSKLMKGE
jgi:hypothetical protein